MLLREKRLLRIYYLSNTVLAQELAHGAILALGPARGQDAEPVLVKSSVARNGSQDPVWVHNECALVAALS